MLARILLACALALGIASPAFAQSNVLMNFRDGTNGVTPTVVDALNPLPSGSDVAIANTPTVQNAAYSSGNAIGGLQTIAFFRSGTRSTGILNNVSVASKGGATTAITLYVFNANPSATTCTDKSAFSLGAADVSKLIATTPMVLTPAVVGAGATVTFASQQSPVSVQNGDSPASANLYVCAVFGGTVTPATTTDLVFKYAGIRD